MIEVYDTHEKQHVILNTLKTMMNLGRREVQMYMNYRRDLEYKVKG